MEYKFGYQI